MEGSIEKCAFVKKKNIELDIQGKIAVDFGGRAQGTCPPPIFRKGRFVPLTIIIFFQL